LTKLGGAQAGRIEGPDAKWHRVFNTSKEFNAALPA